MCVVPGLWCHFSHWTLGSYHQDICKGRVGPDGTVCSEISAGLPHTWVKEPHLSSTGRHTHHPLEAHTAAHTRQVLSQEARCRQRPGKLFPSAEWLQREQLKHYTLLRSLLRTSHSHSVLLAANHSVLWLVTLLLFVILPFRRLWGEIGQFGSCSCQDLENIIGCHAATVCQTDLGCVCTLTLKGQFLKNGSVSLWLLHLLIRWWDEWKVRCCPHSNQTAKSTAQWEQFRGPVRDPSWVSSPIPLPLMKSSLTSIISPVSVPPGTPACPLDKRPGWLAGDEALRVLQLYSAGCYSAIRGHSRAKNSYRKRPNYLQYYYFSCWGFGCQVIF